MESKYDEKEEYSDEESKSFAKDSENESKETDNNGIGIVEKVQNFFYEDEEFAHIFEKFVEENAHTIDLESEENKLEYTELYEEYQKLFESTLEDFITSQGSSVMEFYKEIREAADQDMDSPKAMLGRIMAATCDFDVFMYMMKEGRQKELESTGK
mmetsp:Transcript_33894/g.44708  ORF Transcript_33894/g.44708 Transcript_33894/m.44708 type:complete len:156 (+) Transcript_33894:138-605(+)|eukprot:CAMPEP_0117754646 /NCGR_PEP_ID=MMETSP0947-20121206/12945_1 /TAXON_ID=44440 /ORGANISM="Chattonella subsalsa, Strain CCMP2191" /LENGTH=155 /DNA_ID=CAMNT_0005573759 /DNA_START=136 /DNA_END=603 /DNA_ORIENTATION=-